METEQSTYDPSDISHKTIEDLFFKTIKSLTPPPLLADGTLR